MTAPEAADWAANVAAIGNRVTGLNKSEMAVVLGYLSGANPELVAEALAATVDA